jgi:two-component system, response regulator YesN
MPQRLLVVDDDIGTRSTFDAILRLDGFDVATTAHGNGALSLLRALEFDIVLVDLHLPDMSGLDILRLMHSKCCDTQFILMTGFSSAVSAVEAMKLGACEYLEKPLTEQALLDAVRSASQPVTSNHVSLRQSAADRALAPLANDPGKLEGTSRCINEALRIVHRRYREPGLRIRTVAKELAISPEHLCRLLKAETGEGFRAHLHRIRINEAQRLLERTDLSVKEIAYRTGHRSTGCLDRIFKRLCSVLPGAFRNQRER